MPDRSGSRIDHLNIAVPELETAVNFYEPVLAAIGITKMLEIPAQPDQDMPAMTGFGWPDSKPYFWLVDHGTVGTNMHLAFTVDTRDDVHTFYTAALATSREAPAVHPEYHDDYYGGFVTDPHGIDLEPSATTRIPSKHSGLRYSNVEPGLAASRALSFRKPILLWHAPRADPEPIADPPSVTPVGRTGPGSATTT
ncbi:VOC family protein [Aeromicrobium sp.]|uniref:VOC family protein n=1 Tax=Aeromicrobium sp. TaxID=1871063 RepID=UPI0025C30EFD|nr:VOC family protein [Aeromicrobium sp.]